MAQEIKLFRVTSHNFRYGSAQPGQRCFDSLDAALSDMKERLGEDRFHPDARGVECDLPEVEVEQDGEKWQRVWCRKYSEMPRSSGKQENFGYVLAEELRRPSQPMVNPFEKKTIPS